MTTTPTPAGAHSPGAPDLAARLKAQARAHVPPAVAEFLAAKEGKRHASSVWGAFDAIGEVLSAVEAEGIALENVNVDIRHPSGVGPVHVRFIVTDPDKATAAAFAAGLTERHFTEYAETFTALRRGMRFSITCSLTTPKG